MQRGATAALLARWRSGRRAHLRQHESRRSDHRPCRVSREVDAAKSEALGSRRNGHEKQTRCSESRLFSAAGTASSWHRYVSDMRIGDTPHDEHRLSHERPASCFLESDGAHLGHDVHPAVGREETRGRSGRHDAHIKNPGVPATAETPGSQLIPPHGQGGIRTHGTVSGTPVFETGSFNRSDTRPHADGLA